MPGTDGSGFTDEVVKAIALRKQGVVYMLWGSYAQRKASVVDPQRNCILKAVHPVAPVGLSGIFRLPPFQPRERVPAKHRPGADPMVRMRGGEKLCVCRAHFAGARVARR